MKDTWRLLPSADVLYACDPHWWDHYWKEIAGFSGELWTQDEGCGKRFKGMNRMPGVSAVGLGKDKIHFGGNSGYQAMNLAYLFGAKKIVMLGFDMKLKNGKQHYFGQHPYHRAGQGPNEALFKAWTKNFIDMARDLKAEGVEVVNASRESAIDCFHRGFIESC